MENATVNSNVENLELYSDNYPFRLSLRQKNFEDESTYKKFLKNIEMLVRRSVEYKLWRDYIQDVLQIQECAITHEHMAEVSIETHHHIPSLFSLVKAIVNKEIEEENEFCTFDICQKVIELHYANKIGYLPLLKSIHEKFHNGYLTIPMNLVRGDYQYFLSNYLDFLEDDDIDTINHRLAINETNCSWSRNDYSNDEAAAL